MATSRKIDAALFENRWVDDLIAAGEPQYVLLWLYLIITCRNPVGIFEENVRLWNFKLNPPTPFKAGEVFAKFGKRIRRIDGHPDKGILVGFCDYQRNFSQQSRQWQWVVKDLAAVGLTYEDLKQMDADAVQPELDLGEPPPLAKSADKPQQEKPQRCVIPPQVDWVAAYCSTRNNGIDAQDFCDFYASKGWKIGKEPMRDWQAAVRTWEGKRKKEGEPAKPAPVPHTNLQSMLRRKF